MVKKMKPEIQKRILEAILYFLLLLACILLIINYVIFRSDSGACVRNPKEFLIEHFEKLTGGNITCTCYSDYKVEYKQGYKIIFSSFDGEEREFTGEIPKNVSIIP